MHSDIRIGTLVHSDPNYIRQILPHGFESISITFWQTLGGSDLKKLAAEVKEVIGGRDVKVSTLSIFGNPLGTEAIDEETRASRGGLIGAAMVSDAFFPFRDGVDVGITQGITSIVQPGGSERDFESIVACNEAVPKVAMVYTGQRAFRH